MMSKPRETGSSRRLLVWVPLALLVLGVPPMAAAVPGGQCTEDIALINGAGCFAPCCTQDPPNSGNYVFAHAAVEQVDIRSNPASVASVSFPNLQSVERGVRISYNQPGSMTSISFPALKTAGAIEIASNPSLVAIDLPMLSSIDSEDYSAYLRVQSNPSLTVLNTPRLDSIFASQAGSAYLQVRYNSALEGVDFPLLRTLAAEEEYGEAYIFISSNDAMRSISMGDLRRLSAGAQSISYLVLDDLPQLETLSFPQLTELLPTGGPYDFSELTVGHSPNLEEFVFPSLERVTLLQLTGLKGTRQAKFPRLGELEYLWIFRSCQDPYSTLKIYTCTEQPLLDVLFNNDDGLCGPTGYQLHSTNPYNLAECDASPFCQSFTPALTECQCGSVGLCLP